MPATLDIIAASLPNGSEGMVDRAFDVEGAAENHPLWNGDPVDQDLDNRLDTLRSAVASGDLPTAESILTEIVDHDLDLDIVTRAADKLLRRSKVRSVLRIGRALLLMETRQDLTRLYDAYEEKGIARKTLYNYKLVVNQYSPDEWQYDVSIDVYQFLGPLPPATRRRWLEAAHGQGVQTGKPMGKWKIHSLMLEEQGNLTRQQHLDTGTTPPSQVKTTPRSAAHVPAGGTRNPDGLRVGNGNESTPGNYGQASFGDGFAEVNTLQIQLSDLWALFNEGMSAMRDALAVYEGHDKATGRLIKFIQAGQEILGVRSNAPRQPEPERYLTPDDLEPIEDW